MASDSLLNSVSFEDNLTINGKGGALYVANDSMSGTLDISPADRVSNVVAFSGNLAGSDGGAAYLYNVENINMSNNVHFYDNRSMGNGGALYIANAALVKLNDNINFIGNIALGNGGGMYLSNVASGHFEYIASSNNQAVNGGGVYAIGNGSNYKFTTSKYYENTASGLGGSFYINSNGGKVVFDSMSITGSSAVNGSGVYIESVESAEFVGVTLAENVGANGVYVKETTGWAGLKFNYVTMAENSGVEGLVYNRGNFATSNSLYVNLNGGRAFNFGGDVKVNGSSNNLFYNFDKNQLSSAQRNGLVGSWYDTITAYGSNESGAILDGNGNMVGYDNATNNFIVKNIYLDNQLDKSASTLVFTLGFQSKNSIAYRYSLHGQEYSAAAIDSNVVYDQRGNLRGGIKIFKAEDGSIVYSYVKFEDGQWMYYEVYEDIYAAKVAAARDAALESGAYIEGELNGNVFSRGARGNEINGQIIAVGALQPNMYMTVTTTEDSLSNPETKIHSEGSEYRNIDMALRGGVGLREALY
ncbi:MAG: hypothetical protein RRY34_00020, partial [Victivallaceae bacterium]